MIPERYWKKGIAHGSSSVEEKYAEVVAAKILAYGGGVVEWPKTMPPPGTKTTCWPIEGAERKVPVRNVESYSVEVAPGRLADRCRARKRQVIMSERDRDSNGARRWSAAAVVVVVRRRRPLGRRVRMQGARLS